MAQPAAEPAVSSSSTLWATASKEWVIPAKPKPGRKPKKDPPPPANDDPENQVDSKGRRVQNRAAQRAFRERKQSQLADLQARIQLYEQGEIERNVALQNIAKRLKEENDKLRAENNLLKEKVTTLEGERQKTQDLGKKRWRDDSPSVSSTLSDNPTRKRSKRDSSLTHPQTQAFTSYSSSPPSMVSSPSSNDSPYSPIHLDSPPKTFVSHISPHLSNILDIPESDKSTTHYVGNDAYISCGFCTESTPCVCREIAIQQVQAQQRDTTHGPLKMENFEQKPSPLQMIELSAPSPPPVSILDNLPAYQPPVPLPRKSAAYRKPSLFPVHAPAPSAADSVNNCSGDPSNCVACADDSFGKAFCTAIGESAAADSTPSASDSARMDTDTDTNTMPMDAAWRQLKAHPNVGFADLSLLADVVARRSKCTGPRVVLSPAPGACTPERGVGSPERGGSPAPVLLTDPHAQYRRQHAASPPPTLVPHDVLMQCGQRQRRLREAHADGVKDALRMLDAKFSQS
ncbi:hypothetical protein PLICRDRAFT_694702 [Plicaturopsis crispa FD-325 SS-3]|nr:hypothetical protein PLICRDRAFT_694702 [Plicaturopsis crispa FD-325 SS-3]